MEEEGKGVEEFAPVVRFYKQKKKLKDEDFECVDNGLHALGRQFDVFGVFDGHGGPDAAQLASQKFCRTLVETLQRADKADADAENGTGWEQRVLPQALIDTFELLDTECTKEFKTSGTTATVMVVTRSPRIQSDGWALATIANVGDSHAHAEIAGSIVQLSADHRLDNNEAERERVTREGGEIARCSGVVDDDKADDPLRLWPGGLMMSRTIGDPDAKQALATPEITNLLVRLLDADEESPVPIRALLASDGLWDAVTPKQAFSIVRNRNPQAASQTLIQTAVRNAGKDRDDITLVLVDMAAEEDHFAHGNRRRLSSVASARSHNPPVAAALPGSAAASLRLFHCWDPLAADAPHEEIASAESALAAEHEAREETLREAREERARVEAALRESMQDEEAVAARRAAEEAAAEELENEGEWEPVKRNPRRGDRAISEPDGEGSHQDENSADGDATNQNAETTDQAVTKKKAGTKGKKKDATNDRSANASKDGRKLCFSFKKSGQCSRGDRCRYLHTVPETGSVAEDVSSETNEGTGSKSAEVCRAFQRRSGCPRGNHCKYLHVRKETAAPKDKAGKEGEMSLTENEETTNSLANEVTEDTAAFAKADKENSAIASQAEVGNWADEVEVPMAGEALALSGSKSGSLSKTSAPEDGAKPASRKSSNARTSKKSDEPRPCFSFQRDGACRFGDKCKFSHATTLKATNKQSSASGSEPDKLGGRRPRGNGSRGKANKTTFPAAEGNADNEAPRVFDGPKKCFAFERKGTCKFGDTCKFAHAR
ncbi:Protein phosphatase 2C [Hondaea fermentalgiana]|uniref:Protein phosphatase 2C n=1 Tax=Hondaea fermentalgiana TaxID=2315210 RepID=A0A2R5G414_9STRA|nr:Protein phosphatase 2C [Hondaea fermentalgiana]|eukprot:GBG25740.1 Protein phosphatase 2C [Hondaea fermentalgiana]